MKVNHFRYYVKLFETSWHVFVFQRISQILFYFWNCKTSSFFTHYSYILLPTPIIKTSLKYQNKFNNQDSVVLIADTYDIITLFILIFFRYWLVGVFRCCSRYRYFDIPWFCYFALHSSKVSSLPIEWNFKNYFEIL